MGIPIALPVSAQVIPVAVTFTATFNVPTIGEYDFGIAANENKVFIPMQNRSIYIIERVAFSVNIAEAAYQDSISSVLELNFTRTQPGQQIFESNLPFVNYFKNLETYMFFNSTGSDDNLLGTLTGSLIQVPATVGKTTLTAFVELVVYKINDQEWLARFLDSKNNLGAGLNLRGNKRRDPRPY